MPDGATKRCGSCREVKTLGAFHRNRGRGDGHTHHCKECRTRHPRPHGNRVLRRLLATLASTQSGRCAVCGEEPEDGSLCLDHDHTTGDLRAALCHRCNLVLGHVRDAPELLQSIARYLGKWGSHERPKLVLGDIAPRRAPRDDTGSAIPEKPTLF